MGRTGFRPDWKSALMLAVVAGILCRLLLVLFPLYEERWKFFFNLACVCLAGPVLGMTDASRERGVRLLLVGYLWMACVCMLRAGEYRDPELLMTYLLMAAVSMFLLYPAAFVLDEARGARLLSAASGAYIACVAAMAAAMLFAAFTGQYLMSPGGVDAIGAGVSARYLRLQMFCNSIEAGVYCALALLLLPAAWRAAHRRWSRTLLIVAGIILFVALALSDARTPSWAFCVCFGGAAYLAAQTRLPVRKALPRFLLSALVAGAAAAACYALMRGMAALLNPLIPGLAALREADSEAGSLTGRTDVWASAVRMLRANPGVLWAGAGPFRGIKLVQAYFTFDDTVLAHTHSIALQTVITFGLPGLLLLGAFAAYAAFHAVRLFFFAGARCTMAERMLSLVLVFCLTVDLIETFLSFANAGDLSNPWFFLVAGYVVRLSRERMPARAKSRV